MMKMTDTMNLNRRQGDRFTPPTTPMQWEVRKRRQDDFIPPEQPLDWSDAEPNHQPESLK